MKKLHSVVSTLTVAMLLASCASNETSTKSSSEARSSKILGQSREINPVAKQALALLKEGRTQEASSLINMKLQIDPRNTALHVLNGLTYEVMAEGGNAELLDLAAVGYESALNLEPNNVMALTQLGRLKYKSRDYAKAQEHFANALLLKPSDPELLQDLAAASYYAYDLKTARATIKKAVEQKPDDVLAQRSATMIYAALGDSQKANHHFEIYKTLAGDDPDVARVSARLKDWGSLYGSGRVRLAVDSNYPPFSSSDSDTASQDTEERNASLADEVLNRQRDPSQGQSSSSDNSSDSSQSSDNSGNGSSDNSANSATAAQPSDNSATAAQPSSGPSNSATAAQPSNTKSSAGAGNAQGAKASNGSANPAKPSSSGGGANSGGAPVGGTNAGTSPAGSVGNNGSQAGSNGTAGNGSGNLNSNAQGATNNQGNGPSGNQGSSPNNQGNGSSGNSGDGSNNQSNGPSDNSGDGSNNQGDGSTDNPGDGSNNQGDGSTDSSGDGSNNQGDGSSDNGNDGSQSVPPLSEDTQVHIDCYVLSVQESAGSSKGQNILQNLAVTLNPATLFFGKQRLSGSANKGTPTEASTVSSESGAVTNVLDGNGWNAPSITPTVTSKGSVKTSGFFGALTLSGLSYNLNIANSSDNRTEVISRPSVLVSQGKEAVFFSGNELVVGLTGVSGGVGSLVKYPVGVTVVVTPATIDKDAVTLDISVEGANFTDPNITQDLRTTVNVAKTRVDTSAYVKYGQTLALAGIYERQEISSKDGFPGLMDVPVLQYAFGNEQTTTTRRSIVILMTPRTPDNVKDAVDSAMNNPELSPSLAELELRNPDWFNPEPNLVQAFKHLTIDPVVYYSFQNGDVLPPTWNAVNFSDEGSGWDKFVAYLYY